MTVFTCRIFETRIQDGLLKSVKYWCKATNDTHAVETQGYWTMRLPFSINEDTPESQVIHWLDLDAGQGGKHLIKYRLQEQLDALKSAPSTKPPWAVDTFKVEI